MNARAIASLLEAAAFRITADPKTDPVMKKLADKVKQEAAGDPAKGKLAAERIFKQATGFDPKPEEIDALLELAGLKPAAQKKPIRWLYNTEFGSSFAVPKEFLDLVKSGEAQDLSYRNDVAPSFGKFWASSTEEREIRIWSDHPDSAKREFPSSSRFLVVWYPDGSSMSQQIDTVYEGDDPVEAVKAYREAVKKYWKPEWVDND